MRLFLASTYCHAQESSAIMSKIKIFIREFGGAIDCAGPCSVSIDEVTTLYHKILDLRVIISPRIMMLTALPVRTTRWNLLPLYPCGLPLEFLLSPVQNCRKFSAVRGVTSAKSSILMRPSGSPVVICILSAADSCPSQSGY